MIDGLYDIYGTCHVPFWQTTWWYAGVALLALSFLIFLLSWIVRRVRRRLTRVDYWQDTRNNLQLLARKNADLTCVDLFYVELTDIMKRYLQVRFEGDVVGRTEYEIERWVTELNLPVGVAHEFCAVLSRSTCAKFALECAASEQRQYDIGVCLELLDYTRPATPCPR